MKQGEYDQSETDQAHVHKNNQGERPFFSVSFTWLNWSMMMVRACRTRFIGI